MGSPLRSFIRILAYASWTLTMIPVQMFVLSFNRRLSQRVPFLYHTVCCRILGLHVRTRGKISRKRPTLFVANHTSYVDIAVLASQIRGSFVAKSEVADWPFFGFLAKLQRTVFVDRRGPRVAEHRDDMLLRLQAGDNLILFPEGTSSDGNRVLPFKSALFSVAALEVNGEPVTVQPVSVAYTKLDGMPIGRTLKPYYAWYGDMSMLGHMWAATGLGTVTVDVIFHPPVTIAAFKTRKAIAAHCFDEVAVGVSEANAGRIEQYTPAAIDHA